ncbi:hypothetical protein HYT25_04805 [Candidatus Pacearchaeota archaeon]|nr:hypothetical protein [Candidatus Pacearchaeota archaeon]
MKYAGFRLNKVEAERHENETPKGNINVNSNFNLGKSKKEDLKDKRNVFGFDFTYAIKYEEFATLSFKGVVFIELEGEDRNLLKELESSETTKDNDLRKFILDIVLAKTHVESLHLEERLGLPFHIQSPRVKFGGE